MTLFHTTRYFLQIHTTRYFLQKGASDVEENLLYPFWRKFLQHESMTSVNEDSLEENFSVVKIFSTMRTSHQLQYIRLMTICLGKLWAFFTQRGTSCRRALLMLKKIFDILLEETFKQWQHDILAEDEKSKIHKIHTNSYSWNWILEFSFLEKPISFLEKFSFLEKQDWQDSISTKKQRFTRFSLNFILIPTHCRVYSNW